MHTARRGSGGLAHGLTLYGSRVRVRVRFRVREGRFILNTVHKVKNYTAMYIYIFYSVNYTYISIYTVQCTLYNVYNV